MFYFPCLMRFVVCERGIVIDENFSCLWARRIDEGRLGVADEGFA